MAGPTRDWDAETYQRVSIPHEEWANAVLDRLRLAGDETVLDAGCGSGRVTALVIERLPQGRVVAADGSQSMVEAVRGVLRPQDTAVLSDLTALELEEPVDAVFSSAVFHWIADHELLFRRLRAALRPGGRLAAQCGGAGNIDSFRRAGEAVGARRALRALLRGLRPALELRRRRGDRGAPARRRLRGGALLAGAWAVVPPEPRDFISTVCLGAHLERLPEDLRQPFFEDILAAEESPLTLEYVRLNIEAVAA